MSSAGLKIALIYIYVNGGGIHDQYARRFVRTYSQFPPGIDHNTIIAVNGGQISNAIRAMFSTIPNSRFFPRNNNGWDIGAYQEIASTLKCDAMLCLGESVYYHRKDWMIPLVNAWVKYGEGIYGPYASYQNKPHLNTTAFMCSPALLQSYEQPIVTHAERYRFESTENNVSFRAIRHGLPTKLVTWDGTYEMGQWRSGKNIIRRGDQSNCLMWCNHTDGYFNSRGTNKKELELAMDSMKRIAVFYHARLLGGTPPVANEHSVRVMSSQMLELCRSALFDMASEIHVGLNGDNRNLDLAKPMLPDDPKVHWHVHGEAHNDERTTLRMLHGWARSNPEFWICYFHLKGAMHPNNKEINGWRQCMERATITNWSVCAKNLHVGQDMAGAHWLMPGRYNNWIKSPFWGGNYWWATAAYINQLKPLSDVPNVRPHDILAAESLGGYDVETWIAQNQNPKISDHAPHWPGQSCMI